MSHRHIPLEQPFVRWASCYDALYAKRGRNPAAEVEAFRPTLDSVAAAPGRRRILDVGCGTGAHWPALSRLGQVTGIDRSPEMLAMARERFPTGDWRLHDVQDFDNGERFNAVTMLFGVCTYVATRANALALLRHAGSLLEMGGALVVSIEFVQESLMPAEARTVRLEQPGATLIRHSAAEVRQNRDGSQRLVTTFVFCDGRGRPMWREEHGHLIASLETWQHWLAESVAPVEGSWSLFVSSANRGASQIAYPVAGS